LSLKSLASQTIWYGASNIFGRFLNYFLVLILNGIWQPKDIAAMTYVYTIVPFLNILFSWGFETSYFRYSKEIDKQKLFNTLSTYLLISTFSLCSFLVYYGPEIMDLLVYKGKSWYYYVMVAIVAVDCLSILPFAQLRQEGKPRRFAAIKLLNILVNIIFVATFFLVFRPKALAGTIPSWLYDIKIDQGYFILANLLASCISFLLLLPAWKNYTPQINNALMNTVLAYSLPILLVGFGGMINDFISRVLYYRILDSTPIDVLDAEFGVFSSCYKIAVFATLFIQVFRMAAEPFFFAQSGDKNAPATYARVTKIFSIICCFIFLFLSFNLDIFKMLIAYKFKEYGDGIGIVPLLALGSIFLGVYYNLSLWYKVTNNTMKGAIITLIGVVITIVANYILVPQYHYWGCAWATFICYFSMMVISYLWGQRVYPVPYEIGKISLYFLVSIACFVLYKFVAVPAGLTGIGYGIAFFIVSCVVLSAIVYAMDKTELKSIPIIKKFVK
jgi:O-antigen/teichoic acid export membrane protein